MVCNKFYLLTYFYIPEDEGANVCSENKMRSIS